MNINSVNLVKYLRNHVDLDVIEVNLVECDELKQHQNVVVGFFNPYYEDESISTPIEIRILVSAVSDLDEVEVADIIKQFRIVKSHERIHLEQYERGEYFKMTEDEREEEAYRRELKL